MKKIKFLLITLIALLFMPLATKAASGNVTISGTNRVVAGNKVTITVKISSNVSMVSWEAQLGYDSNYLQLTSTNSESGGTRMAASSATGTKSKSYTFTFKAKKTGSTKLTMVNYMAVSFDDMSEISLTANSKTLSIITQEELEASYSKDNNLKSLEIEGYTISPEFSKDTLNYTVDVPEGTKTLKINATPSDSKSSVSGAGEVEVSEGVNNIAIVVRAENGSEKTYNLVVNVIDQNPINVSINNEDYTVIKLRSNYVCPASFVESETEISGFNIPTCYNEDLNYTLVGLKKSDGTIDSFIYKDGQYKKYLEVVGTSLKIVIEDYDGDLKGFKKVQTKIDDNSYNVFKVSDNSKTYIVYGINVETGDKNFYIYDTVNKTFSLYDNEQVENLNKLNETYLYVIIAFGVALFLSLICIISVNKSKKKLLKKLKEENENVNKKSKVNEKEKNKQKEIIEVTEDEEEYNILEEDKKRKKRKNK